MFFYTLLIQKMPEVNWNRFFQQTWPKVATLRPNVATCQFDVAKSSQLPLPYAWLLLAHKNFLLATFGRPRQSRGYFWRVKIWCGYFWPHTLNRMATFGRKPCFFRLLLASLMLSKSKFWNSILKMKFWKLFLKTVYCSSKTHACGGEIKWK